MREVRSRLGLRSKLFVVFAAIAVALLAVVVVAVDATRSTTAGARNIAVEFAVISTRG